RAWTAGRDDRTPRVRGVRRHLADLACFHRAAPVADLACGRAHTDRGGDAGGATGEMAADSGAHGAPMACPMAAAGAVSRTGYGRLRRGGLGRACRNAGA